MRLTAYPRNEAALMRWPATNGGFCLGFHPDTAREIKRRGWIILDGRRADVTLASLTDGDERIDFVFAEERGP